MAFFAIPALTPSDATGELTSFLASHRVLAIDRRPPLVEFGALPEGG